MRERWNSLCERVGAFGKVEEADLTYEMIQTLYTHPPRSYHNLDHIAHCLELFDEVRLLVDDRDAVEFALWLHDCVFIAERPDNEARSADSAATVAGLLGCRAEFVARVRELIHVTRHNEPPPKGDDSLLADIDLAILAMPRAQYDAYAVAIRDEFSFASDEQFRVGRSAFLERMLSRDQIFASPYFQRKYEQLARDNMERELDWHRSRQA